MSELHRAAGNGSIEWAEAVLSGGMIGVDERTPDGVTPLMFASLKGHLRIVRMLLHKGANVAIIDGEGFSALHLDGSRRTRGSDEAACEGCRLGP